jgi:hypothetical protein
VSCNSIFSCFSFLSTGIMACTAIPAESKVIKLDPIHLNNDFLELGRELRGRALPG